MTQTIGAIPVAPTTPASPAATGASLSDMLVLGAVPMPPAPAAQPQSLATGSLLAQSPFPDTQTFLLHSDPGATKVIYLDFKGFITRNTVFNSTYNTPNIVTPAFSLDADINNFSDAEQAIIQEVWERVSEDFRPFDVDVTTEDPGVAALVNSGGTDNAWGIRVVIGGSAYDWFVPATGGAPKAGVSFQSTFTDAKDTPAFVFAADLFGSDKYIADVASNVTGYTLGLSPDGQTRYYFDNSSMDMTKWHWQPVTAQYYNGHPDVTPPTGEPTSWGPIMGTPYNQELTQWSQGEYPGATNIEDDLAIITTQNGFGYRADDHGSTIASADALAIDPQTAASDINVISDEGIIERNTDVDDFSFSVDGLGAAFDVDITPFTDGPNLDVLAKVLNSSGTVVATSNPVDDILAGSDTFSSNADGGWLLANGTYTDILYLLPGTYYLTVEGTGRPIAYIDPNSHPGPPSDPTMPGPNDPMVPDASDWGYTKYGSLGYYSITGTLSKSLVVGVDFDSSQGESPTNWNRFTGSSGGAELSNLISESGGHVPYTLSISSTGNDVNTVSSSDFIDPTQLPAHGIPLKKLDGYITTQNDTLTFTWNNLSPGTVYQVFVFGSSSADAENQVTVTGGLWNGVQQTYSFTQFISPNSFIVNNNAPGSQDLSTYSLLVVSNDTGQITITVSGADGLPAAVAGLAITTTKVGNISGQKFDDANGNQSQDAGEAGLPGWVVYLDLNNDGQLNSTSGENTIVPAPHVPQPITDFNGDIGGSTTKNQLDVVDAGQILSLTVTLDITHEYDADLRVWLVSPLGTQVQLFANVGSYGQNFTNTTFDDSAAISVTQLTAANAPFTGTFRPEEPLSAFNGQDAQGTWTLLVLDDASGDTGVLNNWSITVKTAGIFLEPYAVTDANGNYSFTNLPAGQYFVREHFSDDQIAAGWKQSFAPTPVTVRSGANVTGIDFGNWIPVTQEGSISGQIFSDLDGDGVKDDNEPGLNGWIAYIDTNNNGVRDVASTPTTITSTDVPKVITDFSTVNSQVEYSGLGTVFSVQVTLDITHTFVGDLDAYLISPSGRQVELFTAVGGQYNDFHNLTLDDNAARSIATLGIDDVPYTGTWQPEGHLSDFNSDDAAGIWTLQIRDTQQFDEGTLNSWSLKITAGEEFRTSDADGNYSFESVPPGSYNVREEAPQGWTQIPPANTTIPAATWTAGRWLVSVLGVDDPANTPADSHRNVKNVNFGNQSAQPLLGDFDRSGAVDALDYVLWRKTLGTSVSNGFAGADGDGDGVVDSADYGVWRNNFGKVIDDFGNDAATANQVTSVPATKHGTIEVAGDVDWFAFPATAGQTYDITTTLGTLSDTVLRLIDTDGLTQLAQNDNATGLASQIHWTAPADGTYYAEVRGAGALTGTYSLSLQVANDDHGDFAADATPILVPSSTPGEIEIPMDHDWFKFNAVANSNYSIDVNLDTLVDSQLSLIASDGTTVLEFDDDGGPGFASHIDWTFAASGTYYLDVNGYGSDLGTYHVTISVSGSGAGAGAIMDMAAEEAFPTANSGNLAFAPLGSGSTMSLGTMPLQTTLAPTTESSNSEAALLAWVASQPPSNGASIAAQSDFHAASESDTGSDLTDSVDSVFDRIGATAVSEALAV